MTDRHKGYVIVLDKDYRDDDAEAIINAIKMVKGVLSVEPIINDVQHMIAQERARHELIDQLWSVLKPSWAQD